ncbi:MAG: glycosyltransferase family 4 protein [Candidatus Dormibacterales bacterium]
MRLGVDLTACWRPRVGMVTASLELARAMAAPDPARLVLLASRERPPGFAKSAAILSPHRHELANKLAWMPSVEASAGLRAILYPYWPSPPLRRRGAPPATLFVHDLAFSLRPREVPWQQRLYLGSVLPRALEGAAAVMVPTAATRSDLLDCYPLPGLQGKVHVVPEGPTPLPSPGPLPAGVEPGFILAVGTLEPRKNYPRLVAAHRLLRARARVPPLVIAGREGWGYSQEVAGLRREPAVTLLGHVDDATLAGLYAHAAAFCFPSLHEGFGIPLLDAMAAGLPCLVGDSGALSEVAVEAALVVPAADTEAIAAGLERVLGDGALRNQLSARGRARAGAFSWERAGAQALAILEATAA